jgi:HNH endonuclease
MVVRDRRYNTQAWRRLRQAILIRDGHTCQVGGPRCEIVATTVHHILPSSQHPERFWDPTNLEAACAPCNAHGGAVAHENSVNRRTIRDLEQTIESLQAELDELRARETCQKPARPRIY